MVHCCHAHHHPRRHSTRVRGSQAPPVSAKKSNTDSSDRIPNLPFFYLVYRAWSHWRAIMGGRHVQWLIQNRLLSAAPSDKLDSLYPKGAPSIDDAHKIQEKMLLTNKQAQVFSEALEMPALAIELERAVWQVEQSLKGKDGERKDGIESSHDTRGKEQSKENKDK